MSERRDGQESKLTRRQAIGASVVGAATLGVITATASAGASSGGSASSGASAGSASGGLRGSATRMPAAFVPHGGGPWPFVDIGMPASEVSELKAYLSALRALPKETPKALLIISAHWEERVPTVMTSEQPPILYDYYGFPASSYSITWPAPGQPQVAARVRTLLGAAGIETAADAKRGFDHGAFIPFKLTYPEADVPALQLSLKAGLDPAEHLAIGRALAPLRDEGVFILGSGMSYHNMGGFRDPHATPDSVTFDAWLRQAMSQEPAERERQLTEWAKAPAARRAHPREEHLMPLLVVAGAAGADRATAAFNGSMVEKRISAFHFSA